MTRCILPKKFYIWLRLIWDKNVSYSHRNLIPTCLSIIIFNRNKKKTQGTSRYNFIANNISQNAKLYSERTVLSIPPYEERG